MSHNPKERNGRVGGLEWNHRSRIVVRVALEREQGHRSSRGREDRVTFPNLVNFVILTIATTFFSFTARLLLFTLATRSRESRQRFAIDLSPRRLVTRLTGPSDAVRSDKIVTAKRDARSYASANRAHNAPRNEGYITRHFS